MRIFWSVKILEFVFLRVANDAVALFNFFSLSLFLVAGPNSWMEELKFIEFISLFDFFSLAWPQSKKNPSRPYEGTKVSFNYD